MTRPFLLAFLTLQIFFCDVRGAGEEEYPVLRTITVPAYGTQEICHYYQNKSTITFKGDVVYGSKYDNMNSEI